jgi:sulfofructosephosphate aldolase
MSVSEPTITGGVSVLERPGGGFAMVALDQRESLRELLGARGSDAAMTEFKADAAEVLSAGSSAVLLDRAYGLPGGEVPRLAPGCALILAADRFVQPLGQPVTDSVLDEEVTPDLVAELGASALKLLVLWRADESDRERRTLVDSFLALCERSGVPGIVEGIVRAASDGAWASLDERDDAIVAAAVEFGSAEPGLYKAEVPDHGRDADVVERRAAEITAAIPCPWVVLSNGVEPSGFPSAVRASCRGGASGFLAGRGVWAGAARTPDPGPVLRSESLDQLRLLNEMVPPRG